MKIYAGLDADGRAKLFVWVLGQRTVIGHMLWLELLDDLGASPGEMLLVSLRREGQPAPVEIAVDPADWRLLGPNNPGKE